MGLYIVLASLFTIPTVYGLTGNWGLVIAAEFFIVAGGYAGEHGFRTLK
jgi:hypothetical protein